MSTPKDKVSGAGYKGVVSRASYKGVVSRATLWLVGLVIKV